ncbi:MAG: hypothetical protein Q8L55_12140 [Phycisphaerales bacterium]|nr:hypothetical protein [Phycisphaerales bacterium]
MGIIGPRQSGAGQRPNSGDLATVGNPVYHLGLLQRLLAFGPPVPNATRWTRSTVLALSIVNVGWMLLFVLLAAFGLLQ